MADNALPSALHVPTPGVQPRSRLPTVLASLALIIACYALWRLDTTLDRLDRVSDLANRISIEQNAMRTDLTNAAARTNRLDDSFSGRIEELSRLPTQLQRLDGSLQELQARANGPQRGWVKSEALFLLDAAQRSVAFDGDVPSAVAALESADGRLATLQDPALLTVRQQIGRELLALRAVPQPDLATVLLRLANAEEEAARIPIKGIVPENRTPRGEALPDGFWARGWAVCRRTFGSLVTVRKVDDAASRVVQPEEQLLRRQHLQLLLFAARNAVVRRDISGYRSSLASARQWLGEFFDLEQSDAESLLDEIQALEPINIAPAVPDIAGSARLLRDMIAARSSP